MVQRGFWFFLGLWALALVFSSSALALDLHATPSQLELRSDSDSGWGSSVTARDNDSIDVRLRVALDGSSPDYSDVESYARVEGRRPNANWEQVTSLPVVSRFMRIGNEQTVYWYNGFRASNAFSEYRLQGFSRAFGENYTSSDFAFVSRIGSQLQCQDIAVRASDVFMNKNDSGFFSLGIRNNSDEDFAVDDVVLEESSDFFSVDRRDFDRQIAAGETGIVEFRVNSFSVSGDQTGSVNAKARGHFANQTCSEGQIPAKNFLVTVRNQGSGSSASCGEIALTAFPAFLPKNSTATKTMIVANNSDRRFLVRQPQLQGSSTAFSATIDSFDSSIAPFSRGVVRVRITSNNVSANQTDSVTIKLGGSFEGGSSCTDSDVRSVAMPVTIELEPRPASCGSLNGEIVEVRLNENEEKEFVFRLQNNSGKRFDIRDIDLNPDVANFTIQRISSFPMPVSGYQAAEIRLKARTSGFLREQGFSVPIRVRGMFEEGTGCGFADTYSSIPFSVSPENTSGGSTDAGLCSKIGIETHAVSMDGGQAVTEEFFVKNNSDRAFFVDGIEAYDYSSGVIVSAGEFDGVIRPGERGGLRAEIEAESSSSDRTATGYLKVRGHFSGERTCSSSSIGSKSFSIRINANESNGSGSSGSGSGSGSGGTGACSGLKVSVPASVFVFQSAPVRFSVSNPADKTAFVFLRGPGLTVSPNAFSIAPNSNKEYSATVQYFQRESSRLEFVPIGENCQGTATYSTIYNTGSGGGLAPQPSNGSGEIRIVSAPSQLLFVKRTTVIATVQNNSGIPRVIQARLDGFSPNWNADKLSIGFEPSETKTVYLDVYSNNNFGSFTGTITAESGNQKAQQLLKLTSVQTVGFGNDVAVETQSRKNAENAFEITARVRNNVGQQAHGVASLETLDGAVLEQKNFVSNPNTVQSVAFLLQGNSGQVPPSAVLVRVVLDDGRSAVQRVELAPGFASGLGFGPGIAGFFSLVDVDSWTPILAGIFLLLLLLALWLNSRQAKREVYRTQKKEILNVPQPAPELAPVHVASMATASTPQATTSTARGSNSERFWFLRAQ